MNCNYSITFCLGVLALQSLKSQFPHFDLTSFRLLGLPWGFKERIPEQCAHLTRRQPLGKRQPLLNMYGAEYEVIILREQKREQALLASVKKEGLRTGPLQEWCGLRRSIHCTFAALVPVPMLCLTSCFVHYWQANPQFSIRCPWSLADPYMIGWFGFGKVCHPLILLFFFSYKQVPIYNLYSSNSADWPFPSQDPHPMLDLCPIPQAISLLVNPTAFLSVIFQIITSLRTTTYTHFFKHILLQVS